MNWVDKIYIISMHKHGIRRQNLYNDLLSAGFDDFKIKWIQAIDGNRLDINEYIRDNKISKTFRDPAGALTKSIYGCALSHKLAYEDFLKTDDSVKTALILEDDAALTHTGLRIMLPNSDGYAKLEDDIETIDWGVIQMGAIHSKIPNEEIPDGFVLGKMDRYPLGYAAHSYIINKSSVKNLIENNKSIQYAADTNIHCSDVEIYCPPISYFSQKTGTYERWTTAKMLHQFEKNILFELDDYGGMFMSSTTYGDDNKTTFNAMISDKLSVKSVDWKPFTNNHGDLIENWANIHLDNK